MAKTFVTIAKTFIRLLATIVTIKIRLVLILHLEEKYAKMKSNLDGKKSTLKKSKVNGQ